MIEDTPRRRRILYFHGRQPRRFAAAVGRHGPASVADLTIGEAATTWIPAAAPADVMAELRGRYVNLLVVDMRHGSEGGLALLDALDDKDPEDRYGFHRILVLVSGPDPEAVDGLIAELGGRGVGRILRDRSDSPETDRAFVERVRVEAVDMILSRKRGSTALCAAGGGTTGIFFELGALKCLDDCLPGDVLHRFDMYFGISAGAIVSAILAAGYSVDEFMAAIDGVEGGRIPPVDLNLLRLGNLNWRDAIRRVGVGAKGSLREISDILRGRVKPGLSGFFLDYTALIGTPFRSDSFGNHLEKVFSYPGATNDFRRLPRKLFIGASDQDSRRHTVFGSKGFDHVPINKAVQASLALNPAFGAVEIEGRYYEDGQVTRTSNFASAIERGADFVLVLDPFVPYVSRTPGDANSQGVLYHIDQDVRSMSFTRFMGVRDTMLRRHPEVSAYTFLPANRLRRLLSSNPMDHRPYLQIFRGGYLSTLARIEQVRHRMRGDLSAHGWHLDTERAEAVAAQLEAVHEDKLTLADFYPDRKIVIKTPPLPLENSAFSPASN